MTPVKDGKADSIQGSLEEGLVAEERDRLNSDSNDDRRTFIAKDRAGSMDGKLLRRNIKARRPLARPSALDPSSMRWSARCGHKRRKRGGSGENNFSYTHRSQRDRSQEGNQRA